MYDLNFIFNLNFIFIWPTKSKLSAYELTFTEQSLQESKSVNKGKHTMKNDWLKNTKYTNKNSIQ